MVDVTTRDIIRKLRSQGMTYSEICNEIGRPIPKGTLSYICKGIALPDEYYIQQRNSLLIRLKEARKKAAQTNIEKLQLRFDSIKVKALNVVSTETLNCYEKIHLAMLYKAEGAKYRSYRGLALGSSEPVILQIYMKLLERCYGKKRNDFHARVQFRADQDLAQLQKYWAKELGLSLSVFYRSVADKRTLGKPTLRTNYMGVCVVNCSGADIQLELDMIAQLYGDKIWGVSSFG